MDGIFPKIFSTRQNTASVFLKGQYSTGGIGKSCSSTLSGKVCLCATVECRWMYMNGGGGSGGWGGA